MRGFLILGEPFPLICTGTFELIFSSEACSAHSTFRLKIRGLCETTFAMGYYEWRVEMIDKVNKGPTDGPKPDAFQKLDAAMKMKAREHSGGGDSETLALLRDLCPESEKLFALRVAAGSACSFRLEIAHTVEWKDYTICLDFGPNVAGTRKELTFSFFDDGAIKMFYWSTLSSNGEEVTPSMIIPNGSATEQDAALQTALEYLRVANRIGKKIASSTISGGQDFLGGTRGA